MKNILQTYAVLGSICAISSTAVIADSGSVEQALAHDIQAAACLAANFEQRTIDQSGQLVQQSSGEAFAARPQQMHWHINSPDTQRIISDGSTLWRYEEDLEQVIISDLSRAESELPIALLSGDAEKLSAYDISKDGETYLLKPKQQDAYFDSLSLSFSDGSLSHLVMRDGFNKVTDISFRPLQTDCQDSSLYAFMPPEHIDIIYE